MADEERDPHELCDPTRPLCPSCLGQNEPEADFCAHCGCPLSATATLDPFRRLRATSYWTRAAGSGRVRPMVFWGTWLLLGSSLLTALVVAGFALGELDAPPESVGDLAGILLPAGLAAALAIFLWRMTGNYLRCRRGEQEEKGAGRG